MPGIPMDIVRVWRGKSKVVRGHQPDWQQPPKSEYPHLDTLAMRVCRCTLLQFTYSAVSVSVSISDLFLFFLCFFFVSVPQEVTKLKEKKFRHSKARFGAQN